MDVRKTRALSDILKDKSLLKDKCYINGAWVAWRCHHQGHQPSR